MPTATIERQLSREQILREIRTLRDRLEYLEEQARLLPPVEGEGDIVVYVDGSCGQASGDGAIAVIISRDAQVIKEITDTFHFDGLTNNHMELEAAIAGAKYAPAGPVTIVSDSQYVVNGITVWIKKWQAQGWKLANGEPVRNQEYWNRLLAAIGEHDGPIQFRWVRGHSTNQGNCLADRRAQQVRRGKG